MRFLHGKHNAPNDTRVRCCERNRCAEGTRERLRGRTALARRNADQPLTGCVFVQLSAGSVRGKNAKNIILKNLLDACFGSLGWYFFGFGIALGEDSSNHALGKDGFALDDIETKDYPTWFFQYTVRPCLMPLHR